eukprot:7268520-Prymnesium_polylepis.1
MASLVAGADLLFAGDGIADRVSVAAFDATAAVACFRDEAHGNYGICEALSLSGDTALTKGGRLVLNRGSTSYTSVAAFGETTAVACFTEAGEKYRHGTCSALSRSGAVLAKGDNLVFDGEGSTGYVSVAAFDGSKGVACRAGADRTAHGTCNALSLTGMSTLTKGDDLVIGQTTHVSVAAFDATTAVACYRDEARGGYATCSAVSLSGSTLAKGDDLVFNGGTSTVSVATLDARTAVVCFEDGDAAHG